MEENQGFSFGLSEKTDINVFIFPYIEKFLVIDMRDDSTRTPIMRELSMQEVFNEALFEGIEEEFSRLLRQREGIFLNLMSLPLKVQTLLQERGIKAVLRRVREEEVTELEPISVFICAGQLLSLTENQLASAVGDLFSAGVSAPLVASCLDTLQRLFQEEQKLAKEMEKQELKDTIEGRPDLFLTLWQDEPPSQK